MSNINKVLFTIFFLLLLLTAGELGYFFLFQNQPKNTNLKPISVNSKNITPTKIIPTPKAIVYTNLAFNQKQIKWLNDWAKKPKKEILMSSILNNQYQGKITNLDLNYQSTISSQIKGKIKITIADNKMLTNSFLLTENDLKNTELYQLVNKQSEPYSFSALKIGNTISLVETIDLKKDPDSNIIKIVITKQ